MRLSAAAATGELLGRFHRGGLFWGTVSTRNMILSGGDPLMLDDDTLARLIADLAAIPRLRRLRGCVLC